MKEMYESGKYPLLEIADRFDSSYRSILRYKKLGGWQKPKVINYQVNKKPPQHKKPRRFGKYQVADMNHLYTCLGKTLSEIASIYHCNTSTISRYKKIFRWKNRGSQPEIARPKFVSSLMRSEAYLRAN
jgi:uncharacterized protein YjcR